MALASVPQRRAGGYVCALARACHPEPVVAVTAMAVALAVSSGRSARGVVAVAVAVLAGQLTVGWHNDWLDAERDARAGRADKPVASGEVPRRAVGWAAVVSGVVVVPLSFLSGAGAGAAHIGAVASALAYNARLKATVLSWAPYCVSFPLLVVFISLGRHAWRWPPWWALVGAGLLGAGAHLANAAPDVEVDRSEQLHGLPARIGAQASMAGSWLALSLATVVVGSGLHGAPRVPVMAAGSAACLLLVMVAALRHRRARHATKEFALGPAEGQLARLPAKKSGSGPRCEQARKLSEGGPLQALLGPRGAFRAAMLVALADVVLLVIGGSSL